MADEEAASAGTAVAGQRNGDTAPSEDGQRRSNPQVAPKDEGLEYELAFATPFGNVEFEFEPQSTRERKAAERKAQAERRAAQKAAEAAMRRARGRKPLFSNRLLIVLVVVAVVGGAFIVAWWLFARPGDEDDGVPPEFANEPQPAAQGLLARSRQRVSDAIRAGRKASRDAQREEREKYERLSSGQ